MTKSTKPSSPEYKRLKLRQLEIVAELARMKAGYFNEGIETPMRIRATLDAELAEIVLAREKLSMLHDARQQLIHTRRNEIVRERLTALGYGTLIEDSTAQARMEIAFAEQSEAPT